MEDNRILNLLPVLLASIGLSLIIDSRIAQNKVVTKQTPKIDLVQEFLKKQAEPVPSTKFSHLKIGVIDVGHVDWKQMPKVNYNQYTLSSNEDQEHGHYVTNEIVQFLNEKKLLSQVEFIYCQVSRKTMDLKNCLNVMVVNKVNLTNISMNFGEGSLITVEESVLLSKLTNSSKVVIAAGNDGLNSGNRLCDITSQNKICVGGYNAIEVDAKSNYEQNVDIYEPFYAQYSNYTGTSFSAPIHLAKVATLMFHGQDYQYASKKQITTRQVASHNE